MNKFIVRHPDGTLSGPLKAHEMLEMAAAGRISPDCIVQVDGRPRSWCRADTIAALRFPKPQSHATRRSVDSRAPVSDDSVEGFGGWQGGLGLFPRAIWDPLGAVSMLALFASEWTMVMAGCGLHLLSSIVLGLCLLSVDGLKSPDLGKLDFMKQVLAISGSCLASLTLLNILTRMFFAQHVRVRIGLDLLAAAVTWLPLLVSFAIFCFGVDRTVSDQLEERQGLAFIVGGSLFVVFGYALGDRLGHASPTVLIVLTPIRLFALVSVSKWIYETWFTDLVNTPIP